MGWMAAPRRERHALGAARMWPFAGLLGLVAAVLLAGCGETNAWPAAAIPPGVEAPASAVEAVRLAIRAHPDDPIALGRAWGALLRDDVAWAGLCVVLDDAQRESRDLSLVLEALARLRGKVSPAPPSIQARLLSMAEHRRDGARHARVELVRALVQHEAGYEAEARDRLERVAGGAGGAVDGGGAATVVTDAPLPHTRTAADDGPLAATPTSSARSPARATISSRRIRRGWTRMRGAPYGDPVTAGAGAGERKTAEW